MNNTLQIALATAVPLWMMEIKARGGPTKEEFERCTEVAVDTLQDTGEAILFPRRKGETTRACGRHDVYGSTEGLCQACVEEDEKRRLAPAETP